MPALRPVEFWRRTEAEDLTDILNGFVVFISSVLVLYGAMMIVLGLFAPRLLGHTRMKQFTMLGKRFAPTRSDGILTGAWFASIGGQQLLSMSDHFAPSMTLFAVWCALTIVVFKRLNEAPGKV